MHILLLHKIYYSMKKTISILFIFLLLLYLLLFPTYAVNAASSGLVLWYTKILPTLLPFAIISNILISTNAFYSICKFLHPLLHLILPISEEGVFPLLAGFLFGFPMGSKICAQMKIENKLSFSEASILFAITNNISPIFISSYMLIDTLHMPNLVLPTYIIIYIPALLLGRIFYKKLVTTAKNKTKKSASRFQINFKIIDTGIMNGFETLTKLGGYIMLFAILTSMIDRIPIPNIYLKALLIGCTEITNGINYTSSQPIKLLYKYVMMIGFTTFGGLSGLAQTSSMIAASTLSMKKYVLTKLTLCFCSCLLAIPVFLLFHNFIL